MLNAFCSRNTRSGFSGRGNGPARRNWGDNRSATAHAQINMGYVNHDWYWLWLHPIMVRRSTESMHWKLVYFTPQSEVISQGCLTYSDKGINSSTRVIYNLVLVCLGAHSPSMWGWSGSHIFVFIKGLQDYLVYYAVVHNSHSIKSTNRLFAVETPHFK